MYLDPFYTIRLFGRCSHSNLSTFWFLNTNNVWPYIKCLRLRVWLWPGEHIGSLDHITCTLLGFLCVTIIIASYTDSSALDIARQIRENIFNATGCKASAGIASNILLARMATRKAKPNGQFQLARDDIKEFIGMHIVLFLILALKPMKQWIQKIAACIQACTFIFKGHIKVPGNRGTCPSLKIIKKGNKGTWDKSNRQ